MLNKSLFLAVPFVILATGSMAQQPMTADEIKSLITGKSVELGSDGIATYKADGSYEYYAKGNGATFRGKWSVQGDRVCAEFSTGSRCDQYLRDGSKIILKNSRGTTFTATVK